MPCFIYENMTLHIQFFIFLYITEKIIIKNEAVGIVYIFTLYLRYERFNVQSEGEIVFCSVVGES